MQPNPADVPVNPLKGLGCLAQQTERSIGFSSELRA